MSTSEHFATYRYTCPHGSGEYVDEWWIPDHPYSPRAYRKETNCSCETCARTFDAEFDGGIVRLRERGEVRRRAVADAEVERTLQRLATVERRLEQRAIQLLGNLTGAARYRLAVAMLAFADEGDAMDFAARRRVPTWVPVALRERERMAATAAYCECLSDWTPLRDEHESARAARRMMGEAPVCHVLGKVAR